MAEYKSKHTGGDIDDAVDRAKRLPSTTGTAGQVLKSNGSAIVWGTVEGGSGAVTSVNGKTGDVVLSADDVGAYTKAESDAEVYRLSESVTEIKEDLTHLDERVITIENNGEQGVTGEFSKKAIYVNVEDYGLVGDGVTDNLAAFNELVAAHPNETLYFGNGVFCFSDTMFFEKCYMILDNAELKLTAQSIKTDFVYVRGYQESGTEFPIDDMFIRGNGTINANGKAKTALLCGVSKCMEVCSIKITGFTYTGLRQTNSVTNRDGSTYDGYSYELFAHHLYIWNQEIADNTYGIRCGGDCTYSDIIILNAKVAIYTTNSNLFHNIHAWCYDFTGQNKLSLAGTYFAQIAGGTPRFTACYIDTYQYGFAFFSSGQRLLVSDLHWYINGGIWDSSIIPVVFVPNASKETTIMGCNLNISGGYGVKFAEKDALSDKCRFTNVISAAANTPAEPTSGSETTTPTAAEFPATADKDFAGYFAANIGGLSFQKITGTGRNAYMKQITRGTGNDIPGIQLYAYYGKNNDCVLTGVATPAEDNDAVNKAYVDGLFSGAIALIGGDD